MSEIKIVFTGSVGSGKTEAIRSLSEINIISTDVQASDNVQKLKETTTIAMDYGEVQLADGEVLALYGTPGQERFSYMWDILAQGALGFVVMVDDSRRDPVDDMCIYLENFNKYIAKTSVVIGVTHADTNRVSSMKKYYDYLNKKGIMYPIMPVDARNKNEVEVLVKSLIAMLEVS